MATIDQLSFDNPTVRDRVRAMREEAVTSGVSEGEFDEAMVRANAIDGNTDQFSGIDLGRLEQAISDRRSALRNPRPGFGPGLSLPSAKQLIESHLEDEQRDAAATQATPRPGLAADIIATAQPAQVVTGTADNGTELRNLTASGLTNTTYWGRVSPDGSVFAIGSNRGVSAFDLRPGQEGSVHFRQGSYDPTFTRDALLFQGGGLWRAPLDWIRSQGPNTAVTGEVPGFVTRAGSLALYQDVATRTDGAIAIDGYNWSGDAAPSTRDPRLTAAGNATMRFHNLDGVVASADRGTQTIATPFHAGFQLSQDGSHVVAQIVDPASPNTQVGYAVYKVNRDEAGAISLEPVRVISGLRGGKAKMGGDNFVAFHHAVTAADFAHYGFASADDPAFQELVRRGTADIYVYDIRNNTVRRATNAGPGNLAWFPSFAENADGSLRVVYLQQNTDGTRRVMSVPAAAPAQTPAAPAAE